jgi:molybdopterin converting factor small subunit
MARLRLFANLREAAGASTVEMAGASVGEVLERASSAFGDRFTAGLAQAKVWVNGEPAGPDTPVRPNDEVALIPPVSGGAAAVPDQRVYQSALVATLVGALLIANYVSLQVFVFVVVGAGMAWAWDLTDTARHTATARLNPFPVFLGIAVAANGAYGWGFAGFAYGTILAVAWALIWGLFDRASRSFEVLATTVLVTVFAALGAGTVVLLRMRTEEEVTVFVAMAAIAVAATWAAIAFGERVPLLDPNISSLVAALIVGIVAGALLDRLTVTVLVLAAVAAAAGLIGGRTFGSLLRTGGVRHTEQPPGVLSVLDGPVLAAGLFWLALVVFG